MRTTITLSQLKSAIKAEVDIVYLRDHFDISQRPVSQITDQQVIRHGPLTTHLSRRLELPKQSVYNALNREARKGNLMKDASPGTICRWWYEGLLDEVRPLIADTQSCGTGD